jgi:hypothetical protein
LNRKKFQVLISKTPTTQTKKDSTKNQNNYKETDKHKQQKKHTHTHARTREHPSVQTKQTHKDKEGGEKKKKKSPINNRVDNKRTQQTKQGKQAHLCASRDEKLQVEVIHTYIPW